jgi:hypothetical protein
MKRAFGLVKSFTLPFIVLGAVCCMSLSPKHGFVALRSPGNSELYFKREVRGLNYDVVVLSTNKDYCAEPNARSDFIFASDPLPMYYSFDGNTLNLFLTSVVAQPSDFQSTVKVVQHHLSPSEFGEIQKSFKERGLELLDIPIDEKLRCR